MRLVLHLATLLAILYSVKTSNASPGGWGQDQGQTVKPTTAEPPRPPPPTQGWGKPIKPTQGSKPSGNGECTCNSQESEEQNPDEGGGGGGQDGDEEEEEGLSEGPQIIYYYCPTLRGFVRNWYECPQKPTGGKQGNKRPGGGRNPSKNKGNSRYQPKEELGGSSGHPPTKWGQRQEDKGWGSGRGSGGDKTRYPSPYRR